MSVTAQCSGPSGQTNIRKIKRIPGAGTPPKTMLAPCKQILILSLIGYVV